MSGAVGGFRRDQFYGLTFHWWAVSRQGTIAQFTAGYAHIPVAVFDDQSAYESALRYFDDLSTTSSAQLSPWADVMQREQGGDFTIALKEASRGLFVYDEEAYGPMYRLQASPLSPIHLDLVPATIQLFLRQFVLTASDFGVAELIDPGCELVCA